VPRDYPSNVRVSARETGLRADTVFLCFQVRSLDPARFVDPRARGPVAVGRLSAGRMRDVEDALRLVLGL
jgi:mRNA interferase MazF